MFEKDLWEWRNEQLDISGCVDQGSRASRRDGRGEGEFARSALRKFEIRFLVLAQERQTNGMPSEDFYVLRHRRE